MGEFFSFLKMFVGCGSLLFLVMLVLLALPQSRLRRVGLEMAKWALAAGLLLMIPSPIDIAPDAIPIIGWLDDLGYLGTAIGAVWSALDDRNRRKLIERWEDEQAMRDREVKP